MIEETFYMIAITPARVHELIPGYPIQLRLHVLSLKNYMFFALKSYMCHFGTNCDGSATRKELHLERLEVHEQLQWLLRLSTC